jgi:hypothetical protein
MTEPEPTTAAGDERPDSSAAPTPPRRQLFRRRPAEIEPLPSEPDPSLENTMIMSAPQPTEIISAQDVASATDDAAERTFGHRPADEAGTPGALPGQAQRSGEDGANEPGSRGALERERRGLVDQREEQVYHLGGLAFELHRRERLPDGVMRRRADDVSQTDARIREIDAALDAIEANREERRQRDREKRAARPAPEPAGVCSNCGTPFQPEASFCWSCGTAVSRDEPPVAEQTEPSTDLP